jgi:hypothetical protein
MFSVKRLFYTYLSRMQIGIRQAVAILALISGYEFKHLYVITSQIVG